MILFLKENTSGMAVFRSPARGRDIVAWVNRKTRDGMPVYQHNITLAITGVSQETKNILASLDAAEYFGRVSWLGLGGETTEIYGYHNGLRPNEYEYNPANLGGGGLITLSSEELSLPYVTY